MSFPAAEHNATSSEWESLDNFFSHSIGVGDSFNLLDVNWPGSNQDEAYRVFEKEVQPLPSAMGNLFDQYESSSEPSSFPRAVSEASLSPFSDAELHESRRNAAKRVKGRPKLGAENKGQPAVEVNNHPFYYENRVR